MKLDIVFVTYNSEKWLQSNVNSILKSDYDLKNKVALYYYDNCSTDGTVDKIYELQREYGDRFSDFKVIAGTKNKGFGYGNNKAAAMGQGDYIFFLNTDTEIKEDTLKLLD